MRLRAYFSGVAGKRSTVAIAAGLALVILAALPRAPKRQEIVRQYPPTPSAAAESGISEPLGRPESRRWSAPAAIARPQRQILGAHQATPGGRDTHLTTPA